jgi:hypothetical protein
MNGFPHQSQSLPTGSEYANAWSAPKDCFGNLADFLNQVLTAVEHDQHLSRLETRHEPIHWIRFRRWQPQA